MKLYTDDHDLTLTTKPRKLPYGGGGNIYVHRQSYEREMAFRRGEIAKGRPYDLPQWSDLPEIDD